MLCGSIIALYDDASAAAMRPVLRAAGFEVIEANGVDDALAHADAERPAAVLLDLDDPESSGFLVCKLLRERFGELLPIILLSGERMSPSDRVGGLLLGADDYLVKPFDPSEVVARLRRLVARSTASDSGASRAPGASAVNDFDLTKREQEIMAQLLHGLTQAEIARELVISPNTVATHIQRILLKLGVHNRAQAVAKAARAGWLERADTSEGTVAAGSLEDVLSPTRRSAHG